MDGLIRKCMNHKGFDTHDFGHLKGTEYGVAQKRFANPLALPVYINGESAQHHDGNGIWHVTTNASRR